MCKGKNILSVGDIFFLNFSMKIDGAEELDSFWPFLAFPSFLSEIEGPISKFSCWSSLDTALYRYSSRTAEREVRSYGHFN